MNIREKAYAKLNISLDVTGRREDGYHEMLMVMQTVSLCDELTLRPGGSGVRARSNLRYVPNDERNLAVRAALRFFEAVPAAEQGLEIDMRKRIPVGAGMGGGSSDAAAVLRALNRASGAPLSREALCELASAVGSDVAFCLLGGTMLATSRGEALSPLPPMPSCRFVIVKPSFSVSTPELFRALDKNPPRIHPDTAGILDALAAGTLPELCRRMYNVFEEVDDRRMRSIRAIKGELLDGGALGAMMTGTGSAVFGVFDDEKAAEACCARLQAQYPFVCTAEPVGTLL